MIIKEFINRIKADGIKKTVRDIRSDMHYNSNAWIDVLSYDDDTKRYRLDRSTVKEFEVPPQMLRVSEDNHHYLTCAFPIPPREIMRDDGTYRTNAITNYLYYISNPINKALEWLYKPKRVDSKALIIVGVGAAIVIYVLYSQGIV